MTSVIIVGLLAGILFSFGLPHLVKGMLGKKFMTPLGQNRSAVENVMWGWAFWVVAVLLWHTAPMAAHPRATFVSAAVGVLAGGLVMAMMNPGPGAKK
ncbi:MAG TPA: hypothetical protein VEH48_02520 [Candidatus Nitrosopolaris sp.]|nr:hypothetical protein [Candidatus Nitrosopolaris sp.]